MSQIHWISSMLTCIIIVFQCLFGHMIPVAAIHIRNEKEKIKIDSINASVLPTTNNVTFSSIYTRIEPDYGFLSVSNGLTPSITTINNNISVEFGVPELNISWVISDQKPSNYSILQNDEIIVNSHPWTENMTVNVTITDLQIGTYEFMIIAENTLGNKANNTIVINVHDTTAPIVTILNPENGHEYNTTNLTITISYTYYIEELSNYTVKVTLNYFNIPDDGLLEYLPAGSYIFNVTVTDSSGNIGSDIVVFFVTIFDQPTTAKTGTTEQTATSGTNNVPAFRLPDLVLFLSIGIVFIVSAFVFIWRRNFRKKISSESELVERYKLPPIDPFDLETNDN